MRIASTKSEQVLQCRGATDRSLPVILDVGGEVPLGDMIDVYDLCRLVRFERIEFASHRVRLSLASGPRPSGPEHNPASRPESGFSCTKLRIAIYHGPRTW